MLSKKEMYRYAGDLSQLFYARQYRLVGGRADGMRAVDVNNGAGLEFTVYVDRAMDIGRFSIHGDNCAYLSKAGMAAPAYYDDKMGGWLKTFNGGLLTTCGLTQVGQPCVDDGEELGLHGDISAAPAEDFCCEVDMDAEIPEIILRGKMRTAKIFGKSICMTREIRVKYGDNKVYLTDKVENLAATRQPYMVLYHMNMGYPLLDAGVKFETSGEYTGPYAEYPEENTKNRLIYPDVSDSGAEEVYYYKNKAEKDGMGYAGIYNEKLKKGIRIWTKPEQLDRFANWKNPYAGDYVMGVEPSNCFVGGREKERETGLKYIEPYEVKMQELIIEAI
ncbi:MAG: aldose 1-epimerase family protein [Christensenella hongkongensis]|uniref:aldose 1-epimerase family protein n=1 Tax=Christensenella hongkongensis TaxID=270498 RepID=UPI002A7554E0|nr:aldose 1-epimerase family protein [Christensenella hongkongensis]MDY3005090.1 aldose 1-epimerase family protein [Christensenella hongkongensis]